ncbi:MAG: hypothetical protein R8K46_02890 [Mariprofundaceae bacterium]
MDKINNGADLFLAEALLPSHHGCFWNAVGDGVNHLIPGKLGWIGFREVPWFGQKASPGAGLTIAVISVTYRAVLSEQFFPVNAQFFRRKRRVGTEQKKQTQHNSCQFCARNKL